MTTTRVFLAPSFELALTVPAPILLTVEAEYGSAVLEGSVYTAAHHQPEGKYSGRHIVEGGRPAPCNDINIPQVQGTIVVSHFDLDTLGGVLRAQGVVDVFLGYEGFWELAEFVDVNGAHKLRQANANEVDLDRLYAFWAFAKTMPRYPRDQVVDVTADIRSAENALRVILRGDERLLAAGQSFRQEEETLNEKTYNVTFYDTVICRTATSAKDFCNHLYTTPEGFLGKCVVCFNTESKTITVSLADPVDGVSCREAVQALWGPLAGGHNGIAGSPRGQEMTDEDAVKLISLMSDLLNK